ncbi:6-bladed beta-propeller [Lunatimonas sp.]|uniref:6-bladed beta-propeller n=1 Tax=Lunatimonas sp. TaxID=2060141 RepID=UPI00263BBE0F|nr:6-bladed beta-propeller [Lunatimonas sp.]
MKYTTLTLLVFPVFLLQNCGGKDISDALVPTTSIQIQKEFLLGGLPELQFEMLDTINLEAKGIPPISSVQDIAFSQNFFFLLDRKQGLLKFDYSGSFLRAIGEIGEGPMEYILPYAIYLEENENKVLVTDWVKMVLISYDLDGKFISSSRLPGRPISLYNENDTLLVIQESIFGSNEKARNVLLSSYEPKTLEVIKHQKNPLYSYISKFTLIHMLPRVLGGRNESSLFYLPQTRQEGLFEHKDTIYRKVEDHLVPEYLLHFTGFENEEQIWISYVEMFEGYACLVFLFEKQYYLVLLDLVNCIPLSILKNTIDTHVTAMKIQSLPRHLKGNMFYSILGTEDGMEEKNPLIVFYRLVSPSIKGDRNSGK